MSEHRVRVLVVDDSAFARKVLRQVLAADPRIDVVGFARDGLDAMEKIAELAPDVITLDLVMPNLDGVGVLEALAERSSSPRVVVVTTSDAESPLGVAALTAGAFDVVHKPTALATDRLYELGDELVAKVVAAAGAEPRAALAARRAGRADATPSRLAAPEPSTFSARANVSTRVVVIGASTGGPRALTVLLRALPGDLPCPVAVVVHMPPGYTEAFAARLDRECPLRVVEASDDTPIQQGTAMIARAGVHLRIACVNDRCRARLDVRPTESLHRPSVDELFKSAAAAYGRGALGVVLTGMGTDGLEGARAIRAAGGRLIVESAESCVVYGMPRAVFEEGLADAQVPVDLMARAIVDRL